MKAFQYLCSGVVILLFTLVAGCADSGGAIGAGGTQRTFSGTDAAPARSESPTEDPLRVELESDEAFVSAAPSGQYLLTRFDGSLCLRSGADFHQRGCAAAAAGLNDWSPTWSPDERHVAVVRAGSSRGGVENDSVWVLDVKQLTAVAITPTDQWLAGAPVPYWLGPDRLGYIWPRVSVTQARVSNLRGGDELIAEYHGLEVESVLASDDAATLAVAKSGGRRGLFKLTSDGQLHLQYRLGERTLLGADRGAHRIITQLPDTHSTAEVRLIETATLSEAQLFPSGKPAVQVAFSPDGGSLAIATRTSPTTYSLATREIDSAAAPADPITISVPERTSLYSGIRWTDTAIVLPCSTDGATQAVLMFARP